MTLEAREEITERSERYFCVEHFISKGTKLCDQTDAKIEAENSELLRQGQQELWRPQE